MPQNHPPKTPPTHPENHAQETLRTAEFPAKHVNDKWKRDLYIACFAFGRTVS